MIRPGRCERFVRRKDDPQAVDGIFQVLGHVQVLADGLEKIGLLAVAEFLVPRLVQ